MSHGHFRDALYGGQEAALEQALRWRDEIEASLPPPTHMRTRDARSRTGRVGVALVVRRRGGRLFRYYVSNWVELDGRRVSRCFAVAKYGEKRARALAEEARLDAERRILGAHGARPWWWGRRAR